MSKRQKPKAKVEKPPYQPTEQEQAALERYRVRVAAAPAAPAAPRMKVNKDDKVPVLGPDHPDKFFAYLLLMEALGTASLDFTNGLLQQLAKAGSQGREVEADGLNFMLSVVKGVKPKDELEAMLAAQMAAIHMAIMTFTRQLAHVETLPQQDSAERALNKLARTYATQMEALKRYRTGGEQKVTVQHVSVGEGGQAIVGNVTQAARQPAPEKPPNSIPALTDARTPAMTILDKPERAPVALRRGKKDDGRSST